ncbi:MAG: DUF4167 domain-containing protein [Rhodospirillales bacterium]
MKHGNNPRRGRSRGSNKRNPSNRNQNIESNGPDAKVRGTAQQVLDKYLILARDAASSGDRVVAESYSQYAEHYYRILRSDQDGGGQNSQGRGRSTADNMRPQSHGGQAPGEQVPDEQVPGVVVEPSVGEEALAVKADAGAEADSSMEEQSPDEPNAGAGPKAATA